MGSVRRQLFELGLEGRVAAGDDDQVERQVRLGQRQRGGQQFPAAFAAGHQQRDRLVRAAGPSLARISLLVAETSSNFGWIG